MKRNDAIVRRAIREYARNRLTTREIAENAGVAKSTVSTWARRFSRLPSRPRGRRSQEAPTPRQLEILRLAACCPFGEVAACFNVTKQNVHRIVARWGMTRPQIHRPDCQCAVCRWKKPTVGPYADKVVEVGDLDSTVDNAV